jgi:phosphatidylinositol kinase/protein kinase (PI-3  family)
MFQNYPGGVNFESAPFKLTQEYIDLMDGPESDKFELFKSLIVRGLIEVRNNMDDLLSFITIM